MINLRNVGLSKEKQRLISRRYISTQSSVITDDRINKYFEQINNDIKTIFKGEGEVDWIFLDQPDKFLKKVFDFIFLKDDDFNDLIKQTQNKIKPGKKPSIYLNDQKIFNHSDLLEWVNILSANIKSFLDYNDEGRRKVISSNIRPFHIINPKHPLLLLLTSGSDGLGVNAIKKIKALTILGSFVGKIEGVEASKDVFREYGWQLLNYHLKTFHYYFEGDIKTKNLDEQRNILSFEEEGNFYVIDAEKHGNILRLINDYRNIPIKQSNDNDNNNVFAVHNCTGITIWNLKRRKPEIILFANNEINKGEEVLLDYGDIFWTKWRSKQMKVNNSFLKNIQVNNTKLRQINKWVEKKPLFKFTVTEGQRKRKRTRLELELELNNNLKFRCNYCKNIISSGKLSTSSIYMCECRKVFYCNKSCQKSDFKEHKKNHYRTIKKIH